MFLTELQISIWQDNLHKTANKNYNFFQDLLNSFSSLFTNDNLDNKFVSVQIQFCIKMKRKNGKWRNLKVGHKIKVQDVIN